MSTIRELLYPLEIALRRTPDARPEFRRAVRTADDARRALEQEYAQLRQQGIRGELLLIDHDHRHAILERRPLPNSSPASSASGDHAPAGILQGASVEPEVDPGLGDGAEGTRRVIRSHARQRDQLAR